MRKLEDVTDVACGGYHTLVIAGGTVYAAGSNDSGLLGFPTNMEVVEDLTPIPWFDKQTTAKPVRVACGDSHSAVILDDGTVGLFGNVRHGQLGNCSKEIREPGSLLAPIGPAFFAEVASCGGTQTIIIGAVNLDHVKVSSGCLSHPMCHACPNLHARGIDSDLPPHRRTHMPSYCHCT